MTHITCRLTAKNRDQLRNPTLGNRVWAAFLRSAKLTPRVFFPYPDSRRIDCDISISPCSPDCGNRYLILGVGAKFCDQRLCTSIRLPARVHSSQMTRASVLHQSFFSRRLLLCLDSPPRQHSRERKCVDTIGTVLVPWAGHFLVPKYKYIFQIYGSSFIKQHSETVMV